MAKELLRTLGGMEYDGLITDTQPRAVVRGVTLAADACSTPDTVYPRGTLLCIKSDEEEATAFAGMVPFEDDGENKPDCILTDTVTITEEDSAGITVTAYFSGCFDPEKILNKEGKPAKLKVSDVVALHTKDIQFKGTLHYLNAKEEE